MIAWHRERSLLRKLIGQFKIKTITSFPWPRPKINEAKGFIMTRFKSDKQRKAVMAKLRGRTASPIVPIILPLQMITGDVIKKGFPTRGSSHRGGSVAFSYVTGKKLPGKFSSLKDVFKKFPREKKAFDKVKRFNKKFNTNITTTRQLKNAEQRIEKFRKKDNPPKKSRKLRSRNSRPRRKVRRFVQSIYG